jgi:hypothetical protein
VNSHQLQNTIWGADETSEEADKDPEVRSEARSTTASNGRSESSTASGSNDGGWAHRSTMASRKSTRVHTVQAMLRELEEVLEIFADISLLKKNNILVFQTNIIIANFSLIVMIS